MNDHNLLVALVSIGIGILLINTILLISNMRDMRKMRKNVNENYEQGKNTMWDNGGIYNGIGTDSNPFETKMACSCSGYGVNRAESGNMPFNNDSNLYNSPLLRPQNLTNRK
jgi:hypothetical protein